MNKKNPPSKQEPFLYRDFDQALKSLKKAFTQGSIYALLCGESGTGKTTLMRTLAGRLDRRRFNVLYLCHGRPSPSALARVLADALHLPIRRTRAETSRMLVQAVKNLPTHLLFFIDEVQLISDDTLHEIRLLSEADLEGPPLFSVLLSGLPEIKERLLSPHLFPLLRRIGQKAFLTGLTREEVGPYLAHGLGRKEAVRFNEQALSILFEQARGIPALLETYATECLKAQKTGTLDSKRVSEILENME